MKASIFIILFIVGAMFSLAFWGESNKPRKKVYMFVAIGIWISLLILGNTIL